MVEMVMVRLIVLMPALQTLQRCSRVLVDVVTANCVASTDFYARRADLTAADETISNYLSEIVDLDDDLDTATSALAVAQGTIDDYGSTLAAKETELKTAEANLATSRDALTTAEETIASHVCVHH